MAVGGDGAACSAAAAGCSAPPPPLPAPPPPCRPRAHCCAPAVVKAPRPALRLTRGGVGRSSADGARHQRRVVGRHPPSSSVTAPPHALALTSIPDRSCSVAGRRKHRQALREQRGALQRRRWISSLSVAPSGRGHRDVGVELGSWPRSCCRARKGRRGRALPCRRARRRRRRSSSSLAAAAASASLAFSTPSPPPPLLRRRCQTQISGGGCRPCADATGATASASPRDP